MSKSSEKIIFPGSSGELLAARLDMPPGSPRAYALFAHCFTCSKDIFAAARISEALVERGFAVMRFDFTGLGASEGEFTRFIIVQYEKNGSVHGYPITENRLRQKGAKL